MLILGPQSLEEWQKKMLLFVLVARLVIAESLGPTGRFADGDGFGIVSFPARETFVFFQANGMTHG